MTDPRERDGVEGDGAHERPVVRDRRRLDPQTGQVREPAAVAAAAGPASTGDGPPPGDGQPGDGQPADGQPADGQAVDAQAAAPTADEPDGRVADLTADLQRVTAEYANYRRRVERDRQAMAEQALAGVLVGLLPVLDDVDRARQHGELTGAFRAVGEALEQTLTKLGLQRFGEPGEPFDPTVHEALTHGTSPDVTEPTATAVYQPGFRLGERVLRPARVGVSDPEPGAAPTPTDADPVAPESA